MLSSKGSVRSRDRLGPRSGSPSRFYEFCKTSRDLFPMRSFDSRRCWLCADAHRWTPHRISYYRHPSGEDTACRSRSRPSLRHTSPVTGGVDRETPGPVFPQMISTPTRERRSRSSTVVALRTEDPLTFTSPRPSRATWIPP